jgi:hypothetical protein
MITRINRVREYRVFQRWAWTHDVPDFSTVNLIYGINGTGKSTLASLLRDTIFDDAWQTGLDVSITDDDGKQRRLLLQPIPFGKASGCSIAITLIPISSSTSNQVAPLLRCWFSASRSVARAGRCGCDHSA